MSFHSKNYDEYLKQFYQVQTDIKNNMRRFDLGQNLQATTTGPLNKKTLIGGINPDLYGSVKTLFAKRIEQLDNRGFDKPVKSKGFSFETTQSDEGQGLQTLIQKLTFSISAISSNDVILKELFEVITYIQQNGFKLKEGEITEAIDNLDEIQQIMNLELIIPSITNERFLIVKSSAVIVKKIQLLLKKILEHVNKPIKNRKTLQSEINKTINFSSFIAKVKKSLRDAGVPAGVLIDPSSETMATGFTDVTFPKPRPTMETTAKPSEYSKSMVDAFAFDDGSAPELPVFIPPDSIPIRNTEDNSIMYISKNENDFIKKYEDDWTNVNLFVKDYGIETVTPTSAAVKIEKLQKKLQLIHREFMRKYTKEGID